jgi:glycosyltransferase involved in cell wall biosynthesis
MNHEPKRVIVSVFNNLWTDQRVEKMCQTLHDNGYEVVLIGATWLGAPEMQRPYHFERLPIKAKVLRMAYAEFQLKLYQALKRYQKPNAILLANDLDSLWPNVRLSRQAKLPLVYDSHEIFTQMPSVQGRWVQKVWQRLEGYCMPHVRHMMCASASYAQWFAEHYGVTPVVVRNLPKAHFQTQVSEKPVVLYQGTLNFSRGIDLAIQAMALLPGVALWICGDGPMKATYQALAKSLNLDDRVKFLGKFSPTDLRQITPQASVGLSIEENLGLSYYYSLPNKISDYIQNGVPVVVAKFPEMQRIVAQYQVGECLENSSVSHLAEKINLVLQKGKAFYAPQLEIAAQALTWEQEESKILGLFEGI